MRQYIRIIGGQHRGKKLNFPDALDLRPTTDRVRETLFNWLMHDIRDAHCLDAFAGSGALGFEAYSRGSSKVLLLELDPKTYNHLKKWTTYFNTDAIQVMHKHACKYLLETKEQFDIIFLDPPFRQPDLLECMQTLDQRPVLKDGGWLYLETPHEIDVSKTGFEKIKQKRYGQVLATLYKKRLLTSDGSTVSINKVLTYGSTFHL